jgi:hypothetical protein
MKPSCEDCPHSIPTKALNEVACTLNPKTVTVVHLGNSPAGLHGRVAAQLQAMSTWPSMLKTEVCGQHPERRHQMMQERYANQMSQTTVGPGGPAK